MEVVVLAGGAGRRFGRIKQLVPVAPDGATLLEITLRDTVHAGCRHAVIVTAPELVDDFQSLFAARPVRNLQVDVIPQRPEDLPKTSRTTLPADVPADIPPRIPTRRGHPWGTAHALWSARDAVRGPFLLFNADDHYGPDAPATLAAVAFGDTGTTASTTGTNTSARTHASNAAAAGNNASTAGTNTSARTHANNAARPVFFLLGYPLGSTLSPEGTVSRAVCEVDSVGRLTALREYPAIDNEGRIAAGPETGRALPLHAPVSMNAWALTPAVFPLVETFLREFLTRADLETDECYFPAAIGAAAGAGEIEVRLTEAPNPWCGMTWPRDQERVNRRLAELGAPLRMAARFGLDVSGTSARSYGGGLIHTTWRVEAVRGPHLLQRLNDSVFNDPAAVAENAAAAAARVHDALRRHGDNDPRRRLAFLPGPGERPWVRDDDGSVWRAAVLIPGARAADPASPNEVREAARLLGQFPGLVAEGEGPMPREILLDFHNTPARLENLKSAADADARRRLAACRQEYDRLVDLAALADTLPPACLPTRLVHNDAKLDNVLVDTNTGEGLCVVDLDMVMPGVAVHDFGDLVRSAVTGRPEDEPDLDRIAAHETIFNNLATGYLEGAAGWIGTAERSRLVDGVITITYEQTLRFLTDHLAGDIYFRVDTPGHNLQRARAQLRLLEELLVSRDRLQNCVDGI